MVYRENTACTTYIPCTIFSSKGSSGCTSRKNGLHTAYSVHPFVVRVGQVQRSHKKQRRAVLMRTALCCLFGLAEVDAPLSRQMLEKILFLFTLITLRPRHINFLPGIWIFTCVEHNGREGHWGWGEILHLLKGEVKATEHLL